MRFGVMKGAVCAPRELPMPCQFQRLHQDSDVVDVVRAISSVIWDLGNPGNLGNLGTGWDTRDARDTELVPRCR